jgi:hypothetical protein
VLIKSPRTTKQKRRIVLLALYILKNYYGNERPRKQTVLDFVQSQKLIHFPPDDEDFREAGEEVWKHDLSWARNYLRENNFLMMPEIGIWRITEKGERDVEQWAKEIKQKADKRPNWVSDFKSHSDSTAETDEEFHKDYYITENVIRWAIKIAARIETK